MNFKIKAIYYVLSIGIMNLRMRVCKPLFISCFTFCLLVNLAGAQIPRTISYQGVLTDSQGAPVADDNYTLQFKLYTQISGGSTVWQEEQSLSVIDGLFSTILGSKVPLTDLFDQPLWLGMTVNGGTELEPRVELTASPYSLFAGAIADSTVTSKKVAANTVVRSINGINDEIVISAGDNIDIDQLDNKIIINGLNGNGSSITAIVAGDGLDGGGNSGDVVLGIADEGVTGGKIAAGQVVKSINNVKDSVKLLAEGGATISTRNDSIIINAGSGGGDSGIQGIQNSNNTLDIINPNGPTTTINIKNNAIGTQQLANGSVTAIKLAEGAVVADEDWNASGNDMYSGVSGNVGVGTNSPAAKLHVKLEGSGNFDHLRVESPQRNVGFGIRFDNPRHDWLVGPNIGNWSDDRFQIASDSSFNWLTLLPNGNVGLTTPTFTTPFARFQVPEIGSLNHGGLNLNHAAIFIGESKSEGMAFDMNQIETVGQDLYLNFNSDRNVLLAEGGGKVSVGAGTPEVDFHIGDEKDILFGKGMTSDGNVAAKMMFLPSKGGAFRAGYLNYDGSIGNGTVFWDPDSVAWASVAMGNNTRAVGTGSVALGVRAAADNFGAVALGHLSRCRANSGLSAGYYNRADAFVSIALGPGNVGGGNPYVWVEGDPLFEVGATTDTTNRKNAFTILKNGKVGIKTHKPQSALHIKQLSSFAEGGIRLEYNTDSDHWETWIDGANDYNMAFNGSLKAYILDTDGSYVTTSDRKLKRNIRPLNSVLEKTLKLEPTSYQYKDSSPSEEPTIGLIANDVEELFPELVVEKEGIKGVKYQSFSIIAIKALQEQQELIEKLESKISRLETRIGQLERKP